MSGNYKRPQIAEPTRGHRAIEWGLFLLLAVLMTLGAFALYSSYSSEFRTVPNRVAEGVAEDRVNILLIGVGGDKHPGGGHDLADAILLVSLKPSTRQVALVSVPRDLYLRIGRYGKHRLNTAHSIGEQSGYPGGGAGLTTDVVSDVFQQPVHAFIRVDFAAFEKVIDDIGGVDINVQRGFYDFLFHDRFEAGPQHMDGKRALRYARYRYIDGPEGDNYARELRQQQVIDAIQEKLRSRGAGDILALVKTAKTLSRYTDTNLTTAQMVWLYRDFHGVSDANVRHVSLKPFMEKFELRTLTDPGEAVRPLNNSFAQVQALSRNIFNSMSQVGTPDDIRLAASPINSTKPAYAPTNVGGGL
jgi:LCP family protein required for cell wall assembly